MKRLLEEAKKIIRINSETSRGNEELANFILAMLQDRGLKVQLQQVTHSIDDISKRQFNVIGILGDPLVDRKIRKGLLLSTHLDTVSPGIPANWTETGGDPFACEVKDDKIYGLGSAEAKIDFLCKLYAVAKMREKKLKMPVYLVGTCGEELGMFGAKYLVKSMALNPRYVVVGQPTGLKLGYAHKSLHLFRISIGFQQIERDARGFNRRVDLHATGRAAHAAYPHLGQNAILASLDFLRRAADAGFEFRFTQFQGGASTNQVPDQSMAQFYLSSHQVEDFKRFFREYTHSEEASGRDFRVELGGVGDTGVRFLPDSIYSCVNDVVEFFKQISGDFSKVKDEKFDPAHSTVNFGKIRQTPGGLSLYFDLRLLPDLVPGSIEQHVQQGIQGIASKYPNLIVSFARERSHPGLNMPQDHELIRICQETMSAVGIEPALDCLSTSTEAAHYFQSGYESVVFGSGFSVGNSHGPNEHNLVDQVEKSIEFYEKLIERTCL